MEKYFNLEDTARISYSSKTIQSQFAPVLLLSRLYFCLNLLEDMSAHQKGKKKGRQLFIVPIAFSRECTPQTGRLFPGNTTGDMMQDLRSRGEVTYRNVYTV